MEDAEYRAGRSHPALRGLVLRYAGYREFSAIPLRRRQAPTGSCTVILSFPPKAAARVLRFQRAAELLVPAGPSISAPSISARSLSTVAATCGYADHPHLVREFRALAGVTPSAYVAEWARVPVRPSPAAGDRPTVAP